MIIPVRGPFRITATFGQVGEYWSNGHKGIDIVSDNRVIFSPANGTVRVVAFDTNGWGQYVSIGDANGRRHILCHMVKGSVKVKEGQKVTTETVIGTMGSTGNSTGVHLHYELHNDRGGVIDVTEYMGCPNKIGTYDCDDTESKQKEGNKMPEKDNTPDKYAKDAIDWAVKDGILVGTDKGDYRLHTNITVQDMLVFLYRSRGK